MDVLTTAADASVVLQTHSIRLGYVVVDVAVVVVVAVEMTDAAHANEALKAMNIHKTKEILLICMVQLRFKFVSSGGPRRLLVLVTHGPWS